MTQQHPPHSVAVLVGNGLSIAHNNRLTIPRITKVINSRLDEVGDPDNPASELMQEVAKRLRINGAAEDFEALVSPFEEVADAATVMGRLADIAGDRKLSVRKSLRESTEFANDLRRHVVSHTLEVIAAESRATHAIGAVVPAFVKAVVDVANRGEVTFGNLNYDSLVMASLVEVYGHRLCDLTDGQAGTKSVEVVDEWPMSGRPLRTVSNLPRNRDISLLHLHGSLTWLRNVKTDRYMRFRIEDLRDSGYWEAWRDGETDWEPVVVLTNQHKKSSLVEQYPFNLAYDTFYARLLSADKWLIAGSSLRDRCVNEMLQKAWRMRSTVPQVMVVAHGDSPTDREIQDAVGYDPIWSDDPDPEKWLNVHRDGIETAPDSFEWMWWSEIATPLNRSEGLLRS